MKDFWELKLISARAVGSVSSDAIATAVVVRHMMGECLSAQAPGREVFGLADWCWCYCIKVVGCFRIVV